MNKKIISGIVILIIVFGGIGGLLLNKNNINKKLEAQINDLKSYHLESNMEMLIGDETKNYKVDVDYLKEDEDLFRVTIYDKVLDQAQVIVRNKEGVFVSTPSINQVYQFKSNWPFNSDKPYIYQILLQYFEKEHETKTDKNGYLLTSLVTYMHDESITHQEIMFDKNFIPQYVSVLDQHDVEKIFVEFTKFELNSTIDKEIFTIKTNVTDVPSSLYDDYPLFPLEMLGSELVDHQKTSINGKTTHILQFSGSKSFTIIETLNEDQQVQEIIPTSGEMVDVVNGIVIKENNQLKVLYPGMTCSIYSSSMSQLELIEVASSLQTEVLK